ncbi:unnamed protein product [Rhodiola kirilowii]
MGKTKKDAQQQAAENALRSLADKYVAHIAPRQGVVNGGIATIQNENGFLWENAEFGEQSTKDGHHNDRTSMLRVPNHVADD